MPQYIRARNPGGTFFFRVVTFSRKNILATKGKIRSLTNAMNQVQSQYPFILEALVVLPDHIHALWTLPEGDADYGKRWGLIKAMFSKEIKGDSSQKDINPSRLKRREITVWQHRFWEHAIRDDKDF
jgi:putative transposase